MSRETGVFFHMCMLMVATTYDKTWYRIENRMCTWFWKCHI